MDISFLSKKTQEPNTKHYNEKRNHLIKSSDLIGQKAEERSDISYFSKFWKDLEKKTTQPQQSHAPYGAFRERK